VNAYIRELIDCDEYRFNQGLGNSFRETGSFHSEDHDSAYDFVYNNYKAPFTFPARRVRQ